MKLDRTCIQCGKNESTIKRDLLICCEMSEANESSPTECGFIYHRHRYNYPKILNHKPN